MDDFEPGHRRAWTISNIAGLIGAGLVLLSAAVVHRSWTFIPAGLGCVLIGGDFIYSRRFLALGWGPAARERVRPRMWHRWIGGVALIAGGCWVLFAGLLQ
jgi:hypothetical protein